MQESFLVLQGWIMIDKKERNILLVIFVFLAFWFTIGIKYIYSLPSNNSSLFYFLFLVGYVLLINKFVFNEGFNFKKVFSLFLIIMVSSVWLPPYLITIDKVPELSTNLRYSGDVFVYNLLPMNFGHTTKYLIVYILIPIILLGLLAYFNDRNRFVNLLKNGA